MQSPSSDRKDLNHTASFVASVPDRYSASVVLSATTLCFFEVMSPVRMEHKFDCAGTKGRVLNGYLQ